ncbi:hypothetical protein KM043_017098 [Ampulex compressa]|nr:hypothetical protein KM043_017098 [Ampulex compressa]
MMASGYRSPTYRQSSSRQSDAGLPLFQNQCGLRQSDYDSDHERTGTPSSQRVHRNLSSPLHESCTLGTRTYLCSSQQFHISPRCLQGNLLKLQHQFHQSRHGTAKIA